MDLDDQRVCELAMVENLQREDLNALEKAIAFRDYLARYGGTQEELAGRLGLDRSTVSNLIRLLDLPERGPATPSATKKITQGHARALLGLPDHDAQRRRLPAGHRRGALGPPDRGPRRHRRADPRQDPRPQGPGRARVDPAGGKAPHVLELEQHLCGRFGTPVQIRVKARERGQIIIDFNSQEEFDRVASMIRGLLMCAVEHGRFRTIVIGDGSSNGGVSLPEELRFSFSPTRPARMRTGRPHGKSGRYRGADRRSAARSPSSSGC